MRHVARAVGPRGRARLASFLARTLTRTLARTLTRTLARTLTRTRTLTNAMPHLSPNLSPNSHPGPKSTPSPSPNPEPTPNQGVEAKLDPEGFAFLSRVRVRTPQSNALERPPTRRELALRAPALRLPGALRQLAAFNPEPVQHRLRIAGRNWLASFRVH